MELVFGDLSVTGRGEDAGFGSRSDKSLNAQAMYTPWTANIKTCRVIVSAGNASSVGSSA